MIAGRSYPPRIVHPPFPTPWIWGAWFEVDQKRVDELHTQP